MKVIISKTVTALYPDGGLLTEDYFRSIREQAFGDTKSKEKEDSGGLEPKKTIMPPIGFGSKDRQHNRGAGMGLGRDAPEHSISGFSSDYDDGGRANDETGPGNTPIESDEYYPSDVLNEVFLDHKIMSNDRDRTVSQHLQGLLNSTGLVPKGRVMRYDPDKIVKERI